MSLFLIDGMTISNRSQVASAVAAKFPKESVEVFTCNDEVPPHIYVPMMVSAFVGKNVIIENGWRAHTVLSLLNEPTRHPKEFLRMLDRIALGAKGHIGLTFCLPRILAERWNQLHPNIPYPEELVNRLQLAWYRASTKGLTQIRINTNDGSFVDDIDTLIDRASLAARESGPGIGNFNPGKVVLLVGDRHGPSIQPYATDYNLAFCDMAKAGSSYWLSQQLDNSNIEERHLYWINAYDKEGIPTEPYFIEQLKPVAILTMGDSAARWCQSNAIAHEQFSHPQYHKRFQFKEPYPLIQRLETLVKGLT